MAFSQRTALGASASQHAAAIGGITRHAKATPAAGGFLKAYAPTTGTRSPGMIRLATLYQRSTTLATETAKTMPRTVAIAIPMRVYITVVGSSTTPFRRAKKSLPAVAPLTKV